MAKLFLMMGCPGSGKSTWLQSHTEPEHDKIVSRDAIRFSLVGPDEEYFSKEDEVFKKYCNEINNYLKLGYNVFADATHLNSSSRKKILREIKVDVDEISVIWIKVSLEVALERNDKRTGMAFVPKSQVRRLFYCTTKPNLEEEFIDRLYIIEENSPIQVIERG